MYIKFDGISSYSTINVAPDAHDQQGDFTYVFLMKVNKGTLMGFTNSSHSGPFVRLSSSAGKLRYQVRSNNYVYQTNTLIDKEVNDNNWHLVVVSDVNSQPDKGFVYYKVDSGSIVGSTVGYTRSTLHQSNDWSNVWNRATIGAYHSGSSFMSGTVSWVGIAACNMLSGSASGSGDGLWAEYQASGTVGLTNSFLSASSGSTLFVGGYERPTYSKFLFASGCSDYGFHSMIYSASYSGSCSC